MRIVWLVLSIPIKRVQILAMYPGVYAIKYESQSVPCWHLTPVNKPPMLITIYKLQNTLLKFHMIVLICLCYTDKLLHEYANAVESQ